MGKQSITVIISSLLILVSFLSIFINLVQNKDLYTKPFDPKLYEKKFNLSQWVIPNSKYVISDEDLYTHAGYKYVMGANPILITPEVPPLGKYIIGASIILFRNQRITSVLAGIASLGLIFLILYVLTKSFFVSSLGVFLSTFTSLFTDQLIHAPQLDIFQLLFFLSFLFFFLLYNTKKSFIYFLLGGMSAGAFVSTKIFIVSFIILNGSVFLFYFLKKTSVIKSTLKIAVLNIIILATYGVSYGVYFFNGGTLRSFLGVQKWVFLFYNDSQIDKMKLLGSYISLIFFNRWKYWSDGYPIISYENWSVLWPIIFILGLFSVYKLFRKKSRKELVIFFISFLIVYNAFLFITPIYPRYLLLLFIPFNMLIALYFGPKIETQFRKYF